MNGVSEEFIIFSDLYRCVVSRFSIRRLLCNRLYQSCAQFQDFHQMAKMNSLRLECKPSWLSELRISFTFESSPSSVAERYALTEDLNYNNPVTQETALLCYNPGQTSWDIIHVCQHMGLSVRSPLPTQCWCWFIQSRSTIAFGGGGKGGSENWIMTSTSK